jgi:hypothetical protein
MRRARERREGCLCTSSLSERVFVKLRGDRELKGILHVGPSPSLSIGAGLVTKTRSESETRIKSNGSAICVAAIGSRERSVL